MQLRSIKEENGQGLDQVRPVRLDAVYCLVVGETSTLLTVEVEITGKCCKGPPSGSQSPTVCERQRTKVTHQATWENREECSTRQRSLGLPSTQAENP